MTPGQFQGLAFGNVIARGGVLFMVQTVNRDPVTNAVLFVGLIPAMGMPDDLASATIVNSGRTELRLEAIDGTTTLGFLKDVPETPGT